MRLKLALLGLALFAVSPTIDACCDDDCPHTNIKFPGLTTFGIQRGDHLVCVNDAQHRIVVDFKRGKSFDLGKIESGRWLDVDVADGLALVLNKDRLQAISLESRKVVHDVPVGKGRAHALGFARKGKAFVHYGRTLEIVDLAAGKTLHTIDFGSDEIRWSAGAWQKVGQRLLIAGPQTTVCVIDLAAGKLLDRFSINSSAGIASIHVDGSLVYCVGSPFSWVPNNHVVCYDMESKKTFLSKNSIADRTFGRLARGPYGTAYLFGGNTVERITMTGERCGTFTTSAKEPVLAVWRHRAVVAVKDEIRLLEIKETPVARK